MVFKLKIQALIKFVVIDAILFVVNIIDTILSLFPSKREKEYALKRNSIFAKQINPNDPYSPYKTCEYPDRLRIDNPNDNVFDRFEVCAKKYSNIETFGVREVLSISDEADKSGKIFKKYELGKYKWQTYKEVYQRVLNLSNGFLNIDMKSKQNILIFSETRKEFTASFLACARIKVPVVTLYATLGIQALKFGINESECSHLIISNEQISKIETIIDEIPTITHIIIIDGNANKNEVNIFMKKYKSKKVLLLSEVEENGKHVEMSHQNFEKPKRDDLAVIMYTSGSTGNPKGVMISHGNLISSAHSFGLRIDYVVPNKETFIAYLPLAHILELNAEIGCLYAGIKIGYSTPQTLLDSSTGIKAGQKGDVRVLNPTMLVAVPLILERFSKAIKEKIATTNWFTQALFQKAFQQKLVAYKNCRKTHILDRLLFRKIKHSIIGRRVKYILCGSALLSERVQDFISVCLVPVRQAYGLTETCGGGTGQFVFERTTNNVGSLIPYLEVKLVDWEEGNYKATDKPNPRGEIYLCGDNVTLGYYKMPEKTLEDYHTIDGVRYFATGDIGEILPNGNIKVIDRKKDLVKLQGGEYLSLSKIEVTLKLLPFIDNCFVHANAYASYAVCIIYPNIKKTLDFAKSMKIDNVEDFQTINKNPMLLKLLQKELETHCLKRGLQRFEIPTKFKLVDDVWLPDSGLVTESLKIKRKALEKFYEKSLEQLYA